jgi:hypothetical protein
MLQIVDHTKYLDNDDLGIPTAPEWSLPISEEANGAAMFGCWVLTLKAWSQCPGEGYLSVNGKRNGKPLSAADVARLTDCPPSCLPSEEFSRCLNILTELGYVRTLDPCPLYQIVAYDEHFENNKSRMRDRCSFVCVPNKHGGTGLSNLLAEADNLAIYGFWMLVLQLCSRQRKPRLGYLTADGKPKGRRLGAAELGRTFQTSKAHVCCYLRVLASPEVGFLELVDGEPESAESDSP